MAAVTAGPLAWQADGLKAPIVTPEEANQSYDDRAGVCCKHSHGWRFLALSAAQNDEGANPPV
jgi:hypothetical protein